MSSNINPYSVDGTFPVAGQDNSSQGFRDNFTNIKNNFISASAEISDLQSKAILSAALNGQTISNDMGGTQIRRPQLTAWTQSLLDLGAVVGNVSLDFNQANFQKITAAGPIALNFINWPATTGSGALGYGVMRVWIVIADLSETVTLPSSVTVAVNDIAGYETDTQTITFDSPGSYIFDFSSIDGGANYQIFDVTRNRASFRDPNFYFNDQVLSTFLVGYGPLYPLALEFETGEDRVSAFGSYNAVAIGNLSLANVSYTAIDNGNQMGGYTFTGIQGNAITGNITGVRPNDMIGYLNGLSYTGINGTANTFQNTGSITFYAKGANVAYGLGGNISFTTARDSTNGSQQLFQAMSIENDQSVHVKGNLISSNTYVPSTSSSGGVAGQITFDANYIYICLAPGVWKRATLSTF